MKVLITILLMFLLLPGMQVFAQPGKVVDHHCNDLQDIPLNWIDSAQSKLKIAYYRASHGSQLTAGGMQAIVNFSSSYASSYAFDPAGENGALYLEEFEADLQHQNSTWVSTTEAYLNSHPECNVLVWAQCDIYKIDVDQYISDMEMLISKYGPGGSISRENPVTFVFMSGHTYPWNGEGIGEAVFYSNSKVRQHCIANNRWFYDFYDIECYDPSGAYFGDGNKDGEYTGDHRLRWDASYDKESGGRGNLGIEWMEANPEDELSRMAGDDICISCEHSEGRHEDDNSRLQCVLKGNAAWSLWARLAGWDPNVGTGNSQSPEMDGEGSGLSLFPNPFHDYLHLDITMKPFSEGDIKIVDQTGRFLMSMSIDNPKQVIDMSDYQIGIYYLYYYYKDVVSGAYRVIKY